MNEHREPTGSSKVRIAAAFYFAAQGVAVAIWWIALFAKPSFRRHFVLERDYETSLLAFWLPDLAFIAVGSIAASWLCLRDIPQKKIAVWFVTGAISYATLYCLAYAWFTDQGWLGVMVMFPAMIWSGVFATGISFEKEMFREAANASTNWILAKTFVQIAVVWSLILVLFPYLISVVEDKLGIARLSFSYQKPIAVILFVGISSLGIASAYFMSRIGKGTPLPLDHAPELVVLGPYAYVRNPMALSGIGQGLAVALFLGSPLVALYALMGSLIWQLVFRPLEEDDMLRRFGQRFQAYRREVKCWVPRTSPYQMDGTTDSSISADSLLGNM